MIALLATLLAVVTAPYAPVSYACNGSTAAFTVNFPYQSQNDLAVTSTTSGGVATTLLILTDYTLNFSSTQSTATLTLTAPATTCPTGNTLKIARSTALTQPTGFRQQTVFNPSLHETALDRLEMQTGELSYKEINDIGVVNNTVAAFNASGAAIGSTTSVLATGSSVPRTLAARAADVANIKDFGAPCNGVGDDVTGILNAINLGLPSSGGTVDARSCTSLTIGSTLTIPKAAVTLLLPNANVALGTNQIIVPAAIHNVAFIAAAPFGSSVANSAVVAGTRFSYTGTGAAIQIGDPTGAADTYGFVMQDVTVDVSSAGSAAVGIQLNRVIGYTLTRPRIGLSNSASTQKAIDLEGFANYTGGRIDNAWISGGGAGASAYYFGKFANANVITGGHTTMAGIGNGTAFNFVGDVTGNASGNMVFGGDVENALTIAAFDFASDNQIRVRSEATTNAATATTHSAANTMFTSGTASMAVSDLGANNSFSDQFFTQLGRNVWRMKNTTDTSSEFQMSGGLTVDELVEIQLIDKTGTAGWRLEKDTANGWELVNKATGINRESYAATGNSFINAELGGGVSFNAAANSGTGGVSFFSGGASPTLQATINGKTRGTITLSAGSGTATVNSGAVCTCSDTTANVSVKCAVSTTTLTATGTGTDVISFLCL